ncbi:putative MFS family arabinose efflux permease [Psychromicrobium silvestre]|uniref:Putative MFS family arabinose efflux permease n=1 Tax=Psychromicrobium silvestre TaxID=1645614 RepID=A0A7Y9LSY9_9MICC|nr:MFS transporter [Psychromicrobium silvestre]NYE94995.1 putative MFS family arabinose efflux permease [Psychromicrobium silvestre]
MESTLNSTHPETAHPETAHPRLSSLVIALLAISAAVATSTSYLLQPELAQLAQELHSSLPTLSAATGSAIVGYLTGLALLVPLIDQVPAKYLISGQLATLGLTLLLASIAANVLLFGFALFCVGACASAGAQMSTLAGKLAAPESRGKALGTVTAGISAGILIGRMVGGALADWLGWRNMLLTFGLACLLVGVLTYFGLPKNTPITPGSYRESLHSLPKLLKKHRLLRVATISGALWFFAFSLIWVSVSIALALPPLNFPPSVIGLYALAGLLGILATRVAGSLADRFGSVPVILSGLGLAGLCALVLAWTLELPPVTLGLLAIFDVGLFSAQVANQSRVLAIDPGRAARFNSAYLVIYFIGGSLGTGIGGAVVSYWGWSAAAWLATAAIGLAALITWYFRNIAPGNQTGQQQHH